MKLTARQEQVLNVIRQYVADTGYPPTRADIARELGFKSPNAAEEHLRALARKGAIEMIAGASRGIRLTESTGIPIVGEWLLAPLCSRQSISRTIANSLPVFSHHRPITCFASPVTA